MAVLAWLLLVSTSLVAGPMVAGPMAMGVHGGDPSAMHLMAATSAADHHGQAFVNHPTADMPDHACCGDPVAQVCDCHFVCASVVHSVAVVIPTPVLFAIVYGPPSRIRAPSPNTAAPLRPPLA